jgi:two-component system, NtrC family, response regulator AtoC
MPLSRRNARVRLVVPEQHPSCDLPHDLRATRSFWPVGLGEQQAPVASLVLVEEERSSIHALPGDGMLLIGRGAEADIQLATELASRKHARLLVADGVVRIVDLDSHNGTFVNGERLEGARALETGDVISIGAATLVMGTAGTTPPERSLLDATQLRQRLFEELSRASRYQRALTLAIITVATGGDDLGALAARVGEALRPLDLVAAGGPAQLLLLLPELDAEAALPVLTRIAELLAALRPRIGAASFPDDGCDADTLSCAARAALTGDDRGAVVQARDAVSSLQIGDRSVIVADPTMSRIYGLIKRLASTPLPVLILGESGAGKENAAFAVHAWSARAGKPFVTLNCAALQDTLVESELFGYEKGAFSGAAAAKPGLLERGSGGTVFLDELKELSLSAQAKLLRALEQKKVTRLGDVREREVDIRLVAATNADLAVEVAAGRFRQDLYFRLNGATVVLPPLRARPREVALLVRHFLDAVCRQSGRPPLAVASATLQRLARHPWPGNVRELKHAVEYAAALADGGTVEEWHLPAALLADVAPADGPVAAPPSGAASISSTVAPSEAPGGAPTAFRPVADELRELERRRMAEALRACHGVQRRAAQLIGMPLRTFSVKLKQYGLKDG